MTSPLGITEWYESMFRWIWYCVKLVVLSLILAFFLSSELRSKNNFLESQLKRCNEMNEILLEKVNAQKE